MRPGRQLSSVCVVLSLCLTGGCDALGSLREGGEDAARQQAKAPQPAEPDTPAEPREPTAMESGGDAAAEGPPKVQQLVVGEEYTCALAGGRVSCWGGNDYAQIGKTREGSQQLEGLPADVVELSAGSYSTCARDAGGAVYCWGRNDSGQLGARPGQPSSEPLQVPLPSPAAQIGAGTAHACARTTSGDVVCWGVTDPFGGTSASKPSLVDGVCKAEALAVAGLSTCVLCEGGTVECWGDASYGQLGDGVAVERGHRSEPKAVKDLSGIVELARVDFSGCGRKDDGTVWCWGWNLDHALANEGPEVQPEPVQVAGITSATRLWGRGTGYCIRQGDEAKTLCWGGNTFGELGDQTLVHRSKPTPAPNFDQDIVSQSCSGWHACASSPQGPISCWGRNDDGQLGNGQRQDSKQPQPVTVFGGPEAEVKTFADAIGVSILQGDEALSSDDGVVDAAAGPFVMRLRFRHEDRVSVHPSFSREPTWKAAEASGMSEAPGNPHRDLVLRPDGNHFWSASSGRFDGPCEIDEGWAVCERTVEVLDTPGGVLAASAWKGRSLFVHVQSDQGYAPSQVLELRFGG